MTPNIETIKAHLENPGYLNKSEGEWLVAQLEELKHDRDAYRYCSAKGWGRVHYYANRNDRLMRRVVELRRTVKQLRAK